MKVLILSSAQSIHTQRWVNSLSDKGLDIVLVSQHPPVGEFREGVGYYQLKNMGVVGYFVHTNRVKQIIKEEEPDVIHAHFASGYGTLARNLGTKYILSVWGSDVYEFPDKSFVHSWLLRRALDGAEALFSTSHCMKKRTQEYTDKSISVIPFGVNTKDFYLNGITTDQIHIGIVKILNDKYGIDVLLNAFALLTKELGKNTLKLSIAGSGPKSDEYQALARELDIHEAVCFLGWIDNTDVPNFLADLDIFVIPSRWDGESFGVVAVEAGAAGLPCVVSDVGGLPEVVVNGTTGIVVEKENSVALAAAVKALIESPKLRRELGGAAKERVESMYEWAENVESMVDCYYEVAGRK